VNQVGLMCSTDDGRLAFGTRFFKQSYGSLNLVNHGSYCGGAYRSGSGAMFGDMKKMPHAKVDLENTEFCISSARRRAMRATRSSVRAL
jgi:tetrathionate reductase subunit A